MFSCKRLIKMLPEVSLLFYTAAALCLLLTSSLADETHDTREGDDVTLECRFNPPSPGSELTYYWVRTTPNLHDNVAIGKIPLQTNYQLAYYPQEGKYDLLISNVSYERDNGRFECRVKAAGSGRTIHAQIHSLVVLTPPKPPTLAPSGRVSAHEAKELQLTCSTSGGSPEPTIKWYREGSTYPEEAALVQGKTRSELSTATLTLMPTREDDGTSFRCVVWNRAMPDNQKLESSVVLSVSYYPRVEVGPENPLRVEIGGTATLECKVDAKPKVPNVRWTRNGKFISTAFTHTLQDVTVQDSGKYICSADNGLGKTGENEIYLDVLYPPNVVIESKTHEAEEGGSVIITCNVTANPEPTVIEWIKAGRNDFKQLGSILRLTSVTSDAAGNYECRAKNILQTQGGKRVEKSGSASVAVLVRHKPGRAHISPDKPVAQEGSGVTLTCSANPPGWPAPQYRWFKDSEYQSSTPIVLATGAKYTIPSAHLGSEGMYHCQATNELGHGEMASITLEVHQPPRFQAKLQPHMTKQAKETDFSVSCSAVGKPKPTVRWLKDGQEITAESNAYEVRTDLTETRTSALNIQTMLKFVGKAREGNNKLMPSDRGVYSCVFENEVKKVESSMHLRIEHAPVVQHQHNKVAYDENESAEIVCKVQAYPKPEFQWYFGSHAAPLQMSSEGYYEITTTTDNNDSYMSVLRIRKVKNQDYGDYHCKVQNALGHIRPVIKLQRKGAPETPKNLKAINIGHNYVTLSWEPGFDGGFPSSTKYYVWYRREALPTNEVVTGDCMSMMSRNGEWMEFDCNRNIPCNITGLDQHQTYIFKVKAVNNLAHSNFSGDITKTTKVDRIPAPTQVNYDPTSRMLSLAVGPTCLSLTAVAESLINGHTAIATWQVVDTIALQLSGNDITYKEVVIDQLIQSNRISRNGGRSFVEDVNPGLSQVDQLNPRVRVKLCLRVNQEHCGEYTEAEIGASYIKEASALTTPTLIAIVVSCLVFLLFLGLLFLFCKCKKRENKKQNAKDYEMDSVRPSMVASQNQAPPPYYPASGMENKALEHSMDLALTMDDSKNVYATQNGYGYHLAPNVQGHPGQSVNGADWVNMGYIENSYPNSNNGGSVNSQDSLWQMKMAAAANNGVANVPQHQMMDRQSYGYDPIAHGGYAMDDYAPYPHTPQQNGQDDFNMRGSQNPSRQEYCSDPYASVHKPKKRMDQHIESPYHDVSGLPDPYMDQIDQMEEQKPPHLSLSYDESLESGYSTPNSRTRRVIREIIV